MEKNNQCQCYPPVWCPDENQMEPRCTHAATVRDKSTDTCYLLRDKNLLYYIKPLTVYKYIIMNKLRIGTIYTDRQIGKVIYIGRIGYEINHLTGVKGSNMFRALDLKNESYVRFTKKEIELLQP